MHPKNVESHQPNVYVSRLFEKISVPFKKLLYSLNNLIIMLMKFLLSVAFGCCFYISLAQLTADAGNNQVVCTSWQGIETITLGGEPSAQQGVPPFTYSWQAYYQNTIGNYTIIRHASHFLVDTTLANPTLNNYPISSPIYFYLTVTDAEGHAATDSVLVKPSSFMSHLGTMSFHLTQGDSLFYTFGSNVGGGIEPYQDVIWRPNHGLLDSTSMNNFWIKPETSQAYYITITDSAGCSISGGAVAYVYVNTANLKEELLTESLLYPNPTASTFTVRHPMEFKCIQIYDAQGKWIKEEQQFPVNIEDLPAGLYQIYLQKKSGEVIFEKLLRE